MTLRPARSPLPALLALGLLVLPNLAAAATCYEGITVAEGCLGLTYEGCCDDAGAALWCETPGGPTCLNPCAAEPGACGWTGSYYYCGGEGADPTGALPMACAACEPACNADARCVGGTCVACTCGDKACGAGTCGQSCGECSDGAECVDGQCVALPACVDVALVACDQVVEGDTATGTHVVDVWGAHGAYGFETAYRFVAAADDQISVSLESATDLVVAVTKDACRPDALLSAGPADPFWLTNWIPVSASATYFVVVDGPLDQPGAFTFTLRCQSTCTPKCDGRSCGDDGCGDTCGACAGVCQKGVCYPTDGCAADKLTGSAGCPGCACEACVCAYDDYCCAGEWDGVCQGECLTVCQGCGALDLCGDGACLGAETCASCAGDCACPGGFQCSAVGECYVPDCAGRECGDDGEGGSCGTCDEGTACSDDGLCVCAPTCDERECGDDGCGGSCGECINDCTGQVDPSFCEGEQGICLHACCRICDGRECGDDGCGGSCGSCGEGETCEAGQCVPDAPPEVVEADDPGGDPAIPEPSPDPGTGAEADELASSEPPAPEGIDDAEVLAPVDDVGGADTGGGGGGCATGAATTTSPLPSLLALGALVLVARRGGARAVPGARRPG